MVLVCIGMTVKRLGKVAGSVRKVKAPVVVVDI
jgi:hypothetical protein